MGKNKELLKIDLYFDLYFKILSVILSHA